MLSQGFKQILYATDLGAHTRPVFRQAVELALRYQAEITMLHVVEPLGRTGESILSVYLPDQDLAELEREGLRKIVERMKQRLQAFCAEELEAGDLDALPVTEILVTTGRVDEQILKQAARHQADLIILGSGHDHHGLTGSNTRRLVQKSTLPVLVIPNR